ncbi:hypothetical protein C5S31_11005 [ANME-1 cluster archaeon GoMg2]|nr:hypothetical protein [ANME-1 cluster archaeon GoMg2]
MNKQIVVILVGLLCLTSIAYAQVSANYDLSWHMLSGSGGQMDSASYIQRSTAGQVIGSSDSSNYRMGAGYWYGAVSADTPPTTGAISIASSPSGAAIELDGASTSYTTNVTIPDVSPGTHTIKLILNGYQDWSTNLSVTAGETSYVHVTLTPTSQIKFDTGPGTYPSISGTYNGTFTPTQTITVSKLYTYPCASTGGHSEHVIFRNVSGTVAEGSWDGYQEAEWSYINFSVPFILVANEQYGFSIRTGSYPQVIHSPTLSNANGTITCTEFVDANGKRYNDWIPAIRLE